jgi:hypothetical protein
VPFVRIRVIRGKAVSVTRVSVTRWGQEKG